MPSRQRRGRDTELLAAEWLRDHGYPDAQAGGCYAPGLDIAGLPWPCEVKARRGLNIAAGLRQAGPGGLLIVRPDRAPIDPGVWWAITDLSTFTRTHTLTDPPRFVSGHTTTTDDVPW